MSDQAAFSKYTNIKDAMEQLGYASRTSINQQVDKGNIQTVVAFKGTSAETRGFLKSDILKLKKKRTKGKA